MSFVCTYFQRYGGVPRAGFCHRSTLDRRWFRNVVFEPGRAGVDHAGVQPISTGCSTSAPRHRRASCGVPRAGAEQPLLAQGEAAHPGAGLHPRHLRDLRRLSRGLRRPHQRVPPFLLRRRGTRAPGVRVEDGESAEGTENLAPLAQGSHHQGAQGAGDPARGRSSTIAVSQDGDHPYYRERPDLVHGGAGRRTTRST